MADIRPGSAGLTDSDFFYRFFYAPGRLGDSVFFAADDGDHGLEWWVSDGTGEGTHRLAGRHVPGEEILQPNAQPAKVRGDLLLFAFDEETGWEPWVTDGTDAGTFLLGDFHHQASSIPELGPVGLVGELQATDERLFLAADDGEHGWEVWSSDGTEEGTSLVVDLQPEMPDGQIPNSSFPSYLVGIGSQLFFNARLQEDDDVNDGLFRSDGEASGTFEIAEGTLEGRAAFSGGVLFSLYPSGLWWSDGTPAGPYLLSATVEAWDLTAGRSIAYFNGRSGDGAALWVTDGTPDGTRELAVLVDPQVDHCLSPTHLAVTPSDRAYFAADDGHSGCEPWVSDGTTEGTRRVLDLLPGPASSMSSHSTSMIAVLGERAVFAADDGTRGREPWVTDGTGAGTRLLGDLCPGPCSSFPQRLTPALGGVFFAANDGTVGEELWVTDGTPAGTRMVRDLLPGPNSGIPHYMVEVDGMLYFAAVDATRGVELWRSDGTAEGTELAFDINPGSGSSSPRELTFSCPNLAFTATDGVRGFEPWMLPIYQGREVVVSDRTITGTERIAACDSITTQGSVVVTGSGGLSLRAGQRIALGEGFAVLTGGRLTLRVNRGVETGAP